MFGLKDLQKNNGIHMTLMEEVAMFYIQGVEVAFHLVEHQE